MSKLMRLNIMGIRSFGTDEGDLQKIKFDSPLTLIQGQNGCGKTTIIEAIKFAISGELPTGCGKGQGFVHDPKLANGYESQGQVKLRISDTKGEWITVSKKVRVIVKGPDKLEYKRLDSTIARGKNDDPNQYSSKCIDVDQEMCLALGVSKPIINNVLFCHQEDSNWPLEESKKLKERFDDIFDATKYNKSLESLGKFIKSKTENLKLLKFEMDSLLDKKKMVEAKKESLQEKEGKLAAVKEEIISVEEQLIPINKRLEEIYQIEVNFTKLYTNVELKKNEVGNLVKQQETILKNIKEFQGTDEELNEKISKFEDDFLSLETDIAVLKSKKQEIEDAEKGLLKRINEKQKKLGGLQSEEDQNSTKIRSQNELVEDIAKDFQLENCTLNGKDMREVKQVITKLEGTVEEKRQEIADLQRNIDVKEKKLQKEIDEIKERHIQLQENITSKTKQIMEDRSELTQVKHTLEELNTADDQLKLMDSKLQRTERDIKSLESSVNTEELQTKVDAEKKSLKSYQERLIEVENEIKELQQYTSIQIELDVKNETLLCKENDLKRLKNKHESAFNHIFKENVPKSDFKRLVQSYQQTQTRSLKDFTGKINNKQREVLRFENNEASVKEKLSDKEKELSSNQEALNAHCKGEPLENVITAINEKLDSLQNNRGVYYSSKYLYQKFIKQFQDDEKCPLCKRGMEEKSQTAQIVDELKKKIENFPKELQRIDKEIAQEQKTVQNLLSLKPANEKIKSLKANEIPFLNSETEKLANLLKKSTEELNTLRNEQSILQKNEEVANSVMGDVSLIDQHQKEIQMLKDQVMDLQRRMPKNDPEMGNRGLEEAMNDKDNLNIDIRTSQNNIESSQAKITQYSERRQKLKEQKNELIFQTLEIKKNLQDRDHLATKSVEMSNKISALELVINELHERLGPLRNELSESNRDKENFKSKHRKIQDQARQQLNTSEQKLNEIVKLQKSIENFALRNIGQQIEDINTQITESKSEIEQYSAKKNDFDTNIDDLKRQVTNSKVYFRELNDNVQLRQHRKQTATLQEEIAKEEAKMGKNDIRKIRQEKNGLMDKEEDLRKQKHTAGGKKTVLIDTIDELKKELELPKNVKAASNFKQKSLELLVEEAAINDLKTFSKAMDWSLMQYHKQRMIQVNSIIKDLWRQIYKGNDIDYIEIRTDDIRVVGQAKRKLYTYHLVQVKNQVPLEMKGRCSAGQRVLASLIIRIALAETFSANCGILALDEPTTNLDRENINSLSDALIQLIHEKRQQKNFQLLIITHDQDFVDRLTQIESLERYHVVKRNPVGKSIISTETRY